MPLIGEGYRRFSTLWSLLVGLAAFPAMAAEPDYLGPVAVVAAADGKRLFVACADARQVVVVNVAGRKVMRSIPMPAEPTGMVLSPDGAALYVTCAAPKSAVCVVETDSGQVVRTIPAGHTAMGPAVSPDGKRLFICNRFDNNVSVIDAAAHREIGRVAAGREPVAAAVSPNGRFIYVVNHLPAGRADRFDTAAVVTTIDARTLAVRSVRLPNGSTNARGICFSHEGKHVFLVHNLARYHLPVTQPDRGWINTAALSVIDDRAGALVNTVLLDEVDLGAANPWAVACSADGRELFVSHSGTHELSVIDSPAMLDKLWALSETDAAGVPNDLAFLVGCRERIALPGNGPRGLVVAGSNVYVTEYFTDDVVAVGAARGVKRQIHRIALGPPPRFTPQRRGEMLFHDAGRGFQHWQSCASCHPDARADALNWDLMNDGLGNPKNTRSMLLAHEGGPAMSLGVRASAAEAVRAGIVHSLFATAPEEDALAIDAYLESLRPVPSPRLVDGRLSAAASRGQKVFLDPKVGCAECHPAPLYSDKQTHNVGSRGRYDRPDDQFTTSRLVEVWRTAPYMHDGRYLSIRDLLVEGRHGLPPVGPLPLSRQQMDDLVEFVLSL